MTESPTEAEVRMLQVMSFFSGPVTAKRLCGAMSLSNSVVDRRLSYLMMKGLVWRQRGARHCGRPPYYYALTEEGADAANMG